jgi:hypothetical protein
MVTAVTYDVKYSYSLVRYAIHNDTHVILFISESLQSLRDDAKSDMRRLNVLCNSVATVGK